MVRRKNIFMNAISLYIGRYQDATVGTKKTGGRKLRLVIPDYVSRVETTLAVSFTGM